MQTIVSTYLSEYLQLFDVEPNVLLTHIWLKYSTTSMSLYFILDCHTIPNMMKAIKFDNTHFGLEEWAQKTFKTCSTNIKVVVVAYGQQLHWRLVVVDDTSTLHMDFVYRYLQYVKTFSVCVDNTWAWWRGILKGNTLYDAIVYVHVHQCHVSIQIDGWECGIHNAMKFKHYVQMRASVGGHKHHQHNDNDMSFHNKLVLGSFRVIYHVLLTSLYRFSHAPHVKWPFIFVGSAKCVLLRVIGWEFCVEDE